MGDMFLFKEKRELTDRRVSDAGPPAGCRERRITSDRRQMKITEISFHEWTSHLLKYQERAVGNVDMPRAANSPDARIKSRG